MKPPQPGMYRVGWTTDNTGPHAVARCPFCETRTVYHVPRPQVTGTLRPLVFRCPICNIEERYAPET